MTTQKTLAALAVLLCGACSRADTIEYALSDVADGPALQLSGDGAAATVWQPGPSGLIEVAFASADGAVAVRSFLDPQTGAPRLLLDETTGEATVLHQGEAHSFALTFVEDDFARGHVAWEEDGVLTAARIEGRPSFSGQLFAQLEDEATASTGSFAVTAADGDTVVTPEGDLVVSERIAVTDAHLALGAALSTLRGAEEDLAAQRWLGALVAIGIHDDAQQALLVGAEAALLAAPLLRDGAAEEAGDTGSAATDAAIEALYASADAPARAAVDLSLTVLSREDSSTYSAAFSRAATRADKGLAEIPERDWDREDLTAPDATEAEALPSGQPLGALPVAGGDVVMAGLAVWQDSTTFDLTGEVGADGHVVLGGDAFDADARISIEGDIVADDRFEGDFVIDWGSEGPVEGEVSDLGDCQSATGAGDQGTFTYAHYVGVGPGTVDFSYEAFSIPDAFTVTDITGETLFSTGDLVSGDETVPLDITAEGAATLFVSVSAPQASTAWEYEVGCIE